MMNLVTGATGHIGNVLIRKLLEKGEKVRGLIWRGEDVIPLNGLDVEKVEGDVLDPASLDVAMRGVERVYHLAGIISIMPGKQPLVWKVNVDGTHNVLEAARRAGVRRLIYTSSIHALGHAPHGVTVDETVGFDPNNPYGEYDRSKATASLEVQAAAKDMDVVLVCPTGVIGPYDFRGSEMGTVIRDATDGKRSFHVGGAYDFVDVRDVADGMIAAMARGRRGEAYLLSGHRINSLYILETVREVTGKQFEIGYIPYGLAMIIAQFMPIYYRRTGTKPNLTPYSLQVLHSNSFISSQKAMTELGYQSRPAKDTIADTVHWFQENPRSKAAA